MRRIALVLLALGIVAPTARGSSAFGRSWDGAPPGNFLDLVGARGAFAHVSQPDFPAGMYVITLDGGYTAYINRDVVGFEGDTVCATSWNGCAMQTPAQGGQTVLQVYMDRPWHLWGTSPALAGKQLMSGSQFAVVEMTANMWRYGFEDLDMGADRDYQDLFGTVTRISQ